MYLFTPSHLTHAPPHTLTHAPPHILTGEAAAEPAGASRGGAVLTETETAPNCRPVLQPSSLLPGAKHLL